MNPLNHNRAISKVLSANDSGETGAHQAGMLIPKDPEILSFFPNLGLDDKNPRVHLRFEDESGEAWIFAFIYYNNSLFGGTRNEYRLTRMTPYIKQNRLKSGDEIVLYVDDSGKRRIRHRRIGSNIEKDRVLRLGNQWHVIPFKGGR